jgi:hypothetical protein
MSDNSAAPSPADTLVKRRHPAERAVVWGLIIALFALAFVETWSRYSYQQAYNFLGNRLQYGDELGSDALDAADVKSFLDDRKPSRTEDFTSTGTLMSNGATHLEVYSWYTLNPVHRREMFVYYDVHGPAQKHHAQVLAIQDSAVEIVPLYYGTNNSPGNRIAIEEPDSNSSMPPRPSGMGRRGGRNGRPGGAKKVETRTGQQADEAGPADQPKTDTRAI